MTSWRMAHDIIWAKNTPLYDSDHDELAMTQSAWKPIRLLYYNGEH